MKKLKQATEIVKLINAVLLGVSIGLSVAKGIREPLRELADDADFLFRLTAARAKKDMQQ